MLREFAFLYIFHSESWATSSYLHQPMVTGLDTTVTTGMIPLPSAAINLVTTSSNPALMLLDLDHHIPIRVTQCILKPSFLLGSHKVWPVSSPQLPILLWVYSGMQKMESWFELQNDGKLFCLVTLHAWRIAIVHNPTTVVVHVMCWYKVGITF